MITKRVIGHIKKTSDILPVAAITTTKTVTPQEVPAHAKTSMKVRIIVKNTGSAPLAIINIKDIIPNSYKPPSLDQIDVTVKGNPIKSGVVLEMSPNNEDPSTSHELTINVPNLNTIAGPLTPGEECIVSYPISAWDPPPADYPCAVDADFNVIPPGPPVKSGLPEFKVIAKQVRRRYRAFKQVQPGGEEGEFKIKVVFQNKGEVPVEICKVTDLVPKDFVLVNWTPEENKPESADVDDGTNVTWTLTNVGAGGEVAINYTIKGSGDYEEEDPEVSFD